MGYTPTLTAVILVVVLNGCAKSSDVSRLDSEEVEIENEAPGRLVIQMSPDRPAAEPPRASLDESNAFGRSSSPPASPADNEFDGPSDEGDDSTSSASDDEADPEMPTQGASTEESAPDAGPSEPIANPASEDVDQNEVPDAQDEPSSGNHSSDMMSAQNEDTEGEEPQASQDAPAPPATSTDPVPCDDSCSAARDGICDDGAFGARTTICSEGTDCTDCGPRLDGIPGCTDDCRFSSDNRCDDGGDSRFEQRSCEYGTDCSDCGIRDPSNPPPWLSGPSNGGCSDTCPARTGDGLCDDGGVGSISEQCELGTDCSDCGPR